MRRITRRLVLTLLVLIACSVAAAMFTGRMSTVTTNQNQPVPLRELANQKNIHVGNHAIATRVGEQCYKAILTREFDTAILDNTPNWSFTDGGLRPDRHSYNFSQMDDLVKFAQDHTMGIRAHHFLWGEEKWLPSWLTQRAYSPTELYEIIKEHIMTVGGRYKGKIREWTVVNEAFSRGQGVYGLRDWWAESTGSKEYIDKAFLWARQADPSAILIINDFGNEIFNPISNEMFAYVNDARRRNIPIDAVGMQMHIDGRHPPKKEDVIANMQRFMESGVPVYITEFDVNMNDVPAPPEVKDAIAGQIYYEMARACIESNGACRGFSILGITDKESWYNYLGIADPRPLPFDKQYRPKPAWEEFYRAFSE